MTRRRFIRRARTLALALGCCAGLAGAFHGAPAAAAELRWPDRAVQIIASEKKLPDFLRELVASQGSTAVIDPKVDGVISGRFVIHGARGDSARATLDKVCESYGLTWYYDGSLMFIEPASEATSEVLPIAGSNALRIAEALLRLQVSDKRYPLTVSQSENSVFVSGPRRYVNAVRQIVQSIDYRASQVDRSEVRMFPLKFAWANDVHLARTGRDEIVPGVVTTLRQLFDADGGDGRVAAATASRSDGGGAQAVTRLSSNRPARTGDAASAGGVADAGTAPNAKEGRADAWMNGVRGPQFRSDARMNAVLVRDIPERMAQYATLISAMDARPRLVEIELTIMDVSVDSLDSLGVDWRAHTSHVDVQTGNATTPALTWGSAATAAGQVGALTPPGVVLTAAIGNELRNFLLTRVSALASKGQATFVATPKVLTLDNTEASLENKSEFYIPVNGFQDSSLYSVTAGTDVRVTPLIVDEADGHSVMLVINIGDDSLGTDTVQGIPIVYRRSVNTQALIGDGKSVLLAGYSSEQKTNADAGVPVLSAIPILGNLFKYAQKNRTKMERFYLLTPRFVTSSSVAAATPAAEGVRVGAQGVAQ